MSEAKESEIIARTANHPDGVAVEHSTKSIAVCCSSLEGNSWDGSVYTYSKDGEMEGMSGFEYGASCVTWLRPGVFAVGMDNGDAAVVQKTDKGYGTKLRMKEHGKLISGICWNVMANRFATSSWDTTVKLWNPDQPRSFETVDAHADACNAVAFSSGSADLMLTGGKDKVANVWSLKSLAASQHRIRCSHAVTAVACGNYGYLLGLGLENGDLYVLDNRHLGKPVLSELGAHKGAINSLTFAGNYLATAGNDGAVNMWKCDTRDKIEVGKHEDYARNVAWVGAAEELYSCGWDKCVKHWTKATWKG